mmetsp:Transcript_40552/g.100153  ORF Transcript_40552/g.100153 Transcript_40552/m.100153 type:complete len:364 (-) Transcript_40552:2273-3364(-)
MELTNVQCTLGAIARDEGVVERFETFVRKAQLLAVRAFDLLHLHLFKAAQDDDPKAFPSMDLNLFKAAARAVCRAEYTSPAAACNAHVDACAMEAVFDKYEQMDGMPTTGVEFGTLKAMRFAHYARCMDPRLVTGVVCAPELLGAFLCNLHPESDAALDIFLPSKERAAIALIVERQLLASQLEDVYLTSYAPLLLETGDTRLASCTNMDAHLTYAGNMWVANLNTNLTGALRRARAAVRRRELRRGAIRRQPHEGRAQGGAQRAVGRDARCATGALGRRVARCARGAAAPSAYGAHDEARRLPPQEQDGHVQPAPPCPRGHAHAAVRRQHAQPLAVRAPRAKLQHAQLRKSGYEDGGAAHPH